MLATVDVRLKRSVEEVLLSFGYLCENQGQNIILVGLKNIDAKLIIIEEQEKIYFQLDILPVDELIDDINLYKDLLSLNYEIVPISAAIDDTEEQDKILILTTTLEVESLDENELVNTVHNFEDSIEKLIILLKDYFIDGIQLKEGEIDGLY